MNKQELFLAITKAAASGLITKDELEEAWRQGSGNIHKPVRKKTSLTNILNGIGAIIVAIGIVLFFEQHWQELTSPIRILVTLGAGIMFYLAGLFLYNVQSYRTVALAFFLIFALVTPFGIWVTFDSLHAQFPFFGYETIISLIMTVWFTASLVTIRTSIFKAFAVVSGSILYFGLTGDFLSHNPAIDVASAFEYRFLFLGLSYVLIGYAWRSIHALLSSFMYFFGIAMFLGAAMSLGGYTPSANLFWEAIFPGLALGSMFLSIPLKSRSVLIVGSLYLMGYIIKITAEYFSETLGWPIALILAGFVLIGIGYATLTLGRRHGVQAHLVE